MPRFGGSNLLRARSGVYLRGMERYFTLTRTLSYSLLFALPLLLLYEAGAVWLGRSDPYALRNGADVLLRTLFAAVGVRGTGAFTGLLVIAALILIFIERRKRQVPIRAAPFVGMLAESVLYALLFGVVIGLLTNVLLAGIVPILAAGTNPLGSLGLPEGVVLSLGAGVYEELVFRVLLVGGFWALFRSGGLTRQRAGIFAALLAALIFSAFHYIGPYGDQWALPSFVFRFLAGLAFSALFLLRGFGITAWTHALYDIFIFASWGL